MLFRSKNLNYTRVTSSFLKIMKNCFKLSKKGKKESNGNNLLRNLNISNNVMKIESCHYFTPNKFNENFSSKFQSPKYSCRPSFNAQQNINKHLHTPHSKRISPDCIDLIKSKKTKPKHNLIKVQNYKIKPALNNANHLKKVIEIYGNLLQKKKFNI